MPKSYKTVAIVNQKGGVGKTTTAVNLSVGIALLRPHSRVLLVDLDAQGNATESLGVPRSAGVHRLLVEKESLAGKRAWQQEGDRDPPSFVDVIPSDHTTLEVKAYLAAQPFREYALRDALTRARPIYDYIILDLAPSVDILHMAALVASDAFLLVTKLSHLATRGVLDALDTLTDLKQHDITEPAFLGVLPTFWDRTTKESHRQLASLVDTFGHLLWPPIPIDVKAREAPAYGKCLWDYAPNCRALNGVTIRGRQVGGYEQAVEQFLSGKT